MILLATVCVFAASLALVLAAGAMREHWAHQAVAVRLARPALHTRVVASAQRDRRRSSIPLLDRVLGAARLGERAADSFVALAGRCPHIRGYRGQGLLGAIELEDSSGSAKSLADAAIWSCLRQGVSTVTKPGGALGFSPPLVISDGDIDWLIERIERALAEISPA